MQLCGKNKARNPHAADDAWHVHISWRINVKLPHIPAGPTKHVTVVYCTWPWQVHLKENNAHFQVPQETGTTRTKVPRLLPHLKSWSHQVYVGIYISYRDDEEFIL
jgi:hypothetical protein